MREFLFLSFLFVLSTAIEKCYWISGMAKCKGMPAERVQVEAYDKDSYFPFSVIDPDDKIGITFTDSDGLFRLEGCASDVDYIPGYSNWPEPYIRILHKCTPDKSEKSNLITANKWKIVPDTTDIGAVLLEKLD